MVEVPGDKPRHISYLAQGDADPRPEFLENLRGVLGEHGSIVAYYDSFEVGILGDLAAAFPVHEDWIEELSGRFVDLWEPFGTFAYYHPNQLGSTSLKAVLPALVGKSYEGMEIADGATASCEYARVTFKQVTSSERSRVRQQLEEYCAMDTLAMVEIVQELRQICGEDKEAAGQYSYLSRFLSAR